MGIDLNEKKTKGLFAKLKFIKSEIKNIAISKIQRIDKKNYK